MQRAAVVVKSYIEHKYTGGCLDEKKYFIIAAALTAG